MSPHGDISCSTKINDSSLHKARDINIFDTAYLHKIFHYELHVIKMYFNKQENVKQYCMRNV